MYVFILIFLLTILIFIALLFIFKKSSSKTHEKSLTYMFNNSPYSPISLSEGFSGIKISQLSQPDSFYKSNRNKTLSYLKAVYPSSDTFDLLDNKLLASFFNSLTFYYNCDFQYHEDDLGSIFGKPKNLEGKWDKLDCVFLPYPPQGVFFNFYTYQKYNIPYVTSNSDGNIPYLNLNNFGNCRPGIAFTTYQKGQEGGIRTGPGMQWVLCRSIQRHIWEPNGIINTKSIGDKDPKNDNWSIKSGIIPSWNYPKGWVNGYADNDFVEVTHFFYGPGGVTTSPGFWFNTFAGTGLFLNLGKTITVNNKLVGVFELAKKLAQTKEGSDILQKYFNSKDPYMITFNFQCGKGKDSSGFVLCNTDVVPCSLVTGIDNDKGLLLESGLGNTLFSDYCEAVVNFQKSKGISSSDTPVYQGIVAAIDASVNESDYNLSKFSVDIQGDEPMFFLALHLGIDTIQIPRSFNSNGYFVYELLDTRLPEKYIQKAKLRDYSDMINIKFKGIDNPQDFGNEWKPEFVQDNLKYIYDNDIITLRDPLDIYNKNKVLKCEGILKKGMCSNNLDQPGNWFNLYCEQNKLSDAYKCLSMGIDATQSNCQLTGPTPTC